MFPKIAGACVVLLSAVLGLPARAEPPRTKAVYLTSVGGSPYLTAEFQRAAGSTVSYQVSSDLLTWLAPGTGGAPGVVATTSPTDPLTTVARLDRPASSGGHYFLRAVGQNAVRRAPLDFDGDGKTDYVVVREGNGGVAQWLISYSGGGSATITFGLTDDYFVPADYDGDGKTDLAVWRPSTGQFLILLSTTGGTRTVSLGAAGDEPTVVGDYDGDGKADVAVFRPATAVTGIPHLLYIGSLNNPGGATSDLTFFQAGDFYFPAPGDYDGDGKMDFCLQGNGTFYLRRSLDGGTESVPFGGAGDLVVRGDYDGDGKSDLIVAAPAAGGYDWTVRQRDGTTVGPISFGSGTFDLIVPGDYDGDGKTDLAVWNADTGVFTVRRSSDGVVTTFAWGAPGDYPVANFQVH